MQSLKSDPTNRSLMDAEAARLLLSLAVSREKGGCHVFEPPTCLPPPAARPLCMWQPCACVAYMSLLLLIAEAVSGMR